jgi:AcrR family transcriptional regulator
VLVKGTYSAVTMEEIAREAGVAYQTVYAVFGTKQRLAQAIVEEGWPHVAPALELIAGARESQNPEVWLRTAARVTRLILEPCADLVRFMRESGDRALLDRYRENERTRRGQLAEVATMLGACGRLRPGVSGDEALAIVWSFTGADLYIRLVLEECWTPERFERWLGDALIALLLTSDSPTRA